MVVDADVTVVDVILFEVDKTPVEGSTLVDNLISGLQASLHKSSVKNLNHTHTHDRKLENAWQSLACSPCSIAVTPLPKM